MPRRASLAHVSGGASEVLGELDCNDLGRALALRPCPVTPVREGLRGGDLGIRHVPRHHVDSGSVLARARGDGPDREGLGVEGVHEHTLCLPCALCPPFSCRCGDFGLEPAGVPARLGEAPAMLEVAIGGVAHPFVGVLRPVRPLPFGISPVDPCSLRHGLSVVMLGWPSSVTVSA